MAADHTPFPEADRIVDDVLDGKRAFVFWPGTGTVVTVIMLHTIAMGIWWAPTVSACIPRLQAHVSNWQPLFLLVLLISMQAFVVPAALLVRGNEYGVSAILLTTRAWLVGAAFMMAAAALEWVEAPTWPYGVACGLLVLAYAFAHTARARCFRRSGCGCSLSLALLIGLCPFAFKDVVDHAGNRHGPQKYAWAKACAEQRATCSRCAGPERACVLRFGVTVRLCGPERLAAVFTRAHEMICLGDVALASAREQR